MDDKRLEDLIRNSWQPIPPDQMKERTLRLGRQELLKRHGILSIFSDIKWKLALITCALLIIALTNISETRRQDRIVAIVCRQSAGFPQTQIAEVTSPQDWERQQSQIIHEFNKIADGDSL